jgi:hypothetical protein
MMYQGVNVEGLEAYDTVDDDDSVSLLVVCGKNHHTRRVLVTLASSIHQNLGINSLNSGKFSPY